MDDSTIIYYESNHPYCTDDVRTHAGRKGTSARRCLFVVVVAVFVF